MRYAIALLTFITTLFIPAYAYAAVPTDKPLDIQIGTPNQGVDPNLGVGNLLSNVLTIVFVVAALAVLFMLVWGAFQWITSGGEKEAVGKARQRIMSALVGLAILALAFFITRVVGQLVGINITDLKSLPTLGAHCGPNQVYDPTQQGTPGNNAHCINTGSGNGPASRTNGG